MNSRGFSLTELIVTIAIISALLAIAIINFGSWQRKSMVERYTKELYSDIQQARTRAAFTKVRQGVEFGVNQIVFRRFSSEADLPGKVVSTKVLPFAFTRTNWTQPTNNRLDFDTRGVMSDPIIKIICLTTNEDAAYDALIITPVLTSMGKVVNRGNACGQNNVIQK